MRSRATRAPDLILKGNNATVSQVAWSTDGRFVLASGQGGKIVTWQFLAQDEHLALKGSDETTWVGPTSAANANRFAAAFGTRRGPGKTGIKVWDQAGQVLFQTTEPALDSPQNSLNDRAVKLSRDGTRLAYRANHLVRANGAEKRVAQIRVWDIATGRSVFHRDREENEAIDSGFWPRDVALSSDGRLLATIANSGSLSAPNSLLTVWELDSGKEHLHRDLVGENLYTIVFSPDGRRVAGTIGHFSKESRATELRVWDVATGQVVLSRKWDETSAREPSYSQDGRWLAVPLSKRDGRSAIKVLDAASGEERHSLTGHGFPILGVTFSPDSRRLASFDVSLAGASDSVKLWDLAVGKELLTFSTKALEPSSSGRAMSPAARSLSFSPDGNRLYYIVGSNGREARVQVWDATPLAGPKQPEGHPDIHEPTEIQEPQNCP